MMIEIRYCFFMKIFGFSTKRAEKKPFQLERVLSGGCLSVLKSGRVFPMRSVNVKFLLTLHEK